VTCRATLPLHAYASSEEDTSPFHFATTIPNIPTVTSEVTSSEAKLNPPVRKSAPKKTAMKKKAGSHQEGIFSPAVYTAKTILGEDELNKVRAKAISVHSDVIKSFVETADSSIGQRALVDMFKVADKNGDGKLDTDEVREALHKLGFSWLKDKQVAGILKRADQDNNGVIDYQEFVAEAPKTLKTNLVKLAKKNGGELGFLV